MSCEAGGDPEPHVWWSRVDTKVTSEHHIQELYNIEIQGVTRLVLPDDPSLLHLVRVAQEDTGEYVCQARNSISTAEVNIYLQVHCE